MKRDAVIIGGGISGLATAYRLKKQGLDVLLLEKAEQPGGAILTKSIDGFLIDCGPNSTLETSPAIHDFIREIGLEEAQIYADERTKKRYILKKGRLCCLPMSPQAFLTSRLFSTKAKCRVLAEPFIQPGSQHKEETIAEFGERRFGREFLDYAINPFVAGVYAGDPDKLSVRCAVAKIGAFEEKYGSVITGAIKSARARKRDGRAEPAGTRLFSFEQGMSALVNALAQNLAPAVRTGSTVLSVAAGSAGEGFEISAETAGLKENVQTRALILTTPAWVSAELLSSMSSQLSSVLKEIDYPPVAMVFFGFRQQPACRALDGFGFLVPEIESRQILGSIWTSTIFPGRTPDNGIAMTSFVGGARQPELTQRSDEELVELVLSDLQQILTFPEKPDVTYVKRWQKAIPQYTLGHQDRVEAVEDFEATHPGLFISGNYRGGISVGDCILNSDIVANRVTTHLKAATQAKLQT